MMQRITFPVPLRVADVTIHNPFWRRYLELIRTKVLPYQWDALNDRVEGAEPSHCMHNFRVAAGREEGSFGGFVFQDSDVMKWIEAAAFSLMWHPDPGLEQTVDGAIDDICAAQQPDGYLNTYYILNGLDGRFTNLKDNHELYCLGHMLEAATAYYQATGKDKLLNAAVRYVDLVDRLFGAEPGKLPGYPGHEVLEMALVRLYEITQDEKHLRLAKYFIDQRGQSPLYFEEEDRKNHNAFLWDDAYFRYQYYQAGKPVREQAAAEGHAVRAVYLYSGMADVARMTGDQELRRACERLWSNITRRQMYVTGAIGASEHGESFTFDYDLPNDTVYGETCASIGMAFLAKRMLELEPKAEYADVLERELYNGIISGIALDGTRFFYVNPLEVNPKACEQDYHKRHVKPQRQPWFGCACCPPNIARILASLGSYLGAVSGDMFWLHLYVGGEIKARLDGGDAKLQIETGYPWDGKVKISVVPEQEQRFTLALRVPGWCESWSLRINGAEAAPACEAGYLMLERRWKPGDQVEFVMEMPVRLVQANPRVREDLGRVCVTRGPVVYCLEEADNGPELHRLGLTAESEFSARYEPELLGGVVTLEANGKRLSDTGWGDALYRRYQRPSYEEQKLRWIPYYAWANRGLGEMSVWVRDWGC